MAIRHQSVLPAFRERDAPTAGYRNKKNARRATPEIGLENTYPGWLPDNLPPKHDNRKRKWDSHTTA